MLLKLGMFYAVRQVGGLPHVCISVYLIIVQLLVCVYTYIYGDYCLLAADLVDSSEHVVPRIRSNA